MRWMPRACSPSTGCPASSSPTPPAAVRGTARLAGGAVHRADATSRTIPSLAGVINESTADRAAEKLGNKTVRDVLPEHLTDVPAANADDTIIEVAALMARLRSPLIAVMKDGKLHGVITASRLARRGIEALIRLAAAIAITVFVVAYALIASDRINKTLVALSGAAIVLALGIVDSARRVLLPRDRNRLGRHLSAAGDDDHRRRAAADRRLRVHRDLVGQTGQAVPRCGS